MQVEKEIKYLTFRESKQLVEETENIRHRLWSLLMIDCGLRVSELVTLKISNFDFRKRELHVESLKKRDKTLIRTIPISSRLYYVLATYLHDLKFTGDQYLFPGKDGKTHITSFAVNKPRNLGGVILVEDAQTVGK